MEPDYNYGLDLRRRAARDLHNAGWPIEDIAHALRIESATAERYVSKASVAEIARFRMRGWPIDDNSLELITG